MDNRQLKRRIAILESLQERRIIAEQQRQNIVAMLIADKQREIDNFKAQLVENPPPLRSVG